LLHNDAELYQVFIFPPRLFELGTGTIRQWAGTLTFS